MHKQYRIRDYDIKLVIMVIALNVIGVMAIGSAKESVQSKQLLGLIAGAFIMVVISFLDYNVLLKLYWIMYIGNLALLIMVKLPIFGKEAGGAQRWLNIFGFQFQPSESAKIILILFFAQFIMLNKEYLNTFKYIMLCIILLAPPLLLIYLQPDMSTSIMVMIIFCVVMFVGGVSYKLVGGILAVAIPAVATVFFLILQPVENNILIDMGMIKPYHRLRVLAWLHPEDYANTIAYQQMNSMIAVGSGQLMGKGYKTNVISSVKNGNFISEPQTDFIFAVIGEEFGFVGCCTVIGLLVLIVLECFSIARKAKNLAGTIIASGVAALIGFQGFMNISVATGLLPNTGIPLPLVSYGLTSLLSVYIGIGFVLNVRLHGKKY
ncbi:MAG: rod shape-determining protein RodA [Lachnospiraceae bacterium]|nr:rod shape-determining protein RodA [Lachnospiraceae bacterium]